MRIVSLACKPLSVPLREPFVIASARIDATRAALVHAVLEDERGARATGLGEAAALHPVTREDQPDLLRAIEHAAVGCVGARVRDLEALSALLDETLVDFPVSRAGVECALLDAWAQLSRVSLCAMLGGAPLTLVSDITLPIAEPMHMAELARAYRTRGFTAFKVKVGKCFDDDARALLAVHARVTDATFRLDANAGFDARQALDLCALAKRAGLRVDCFEQPCATDDLDAMAKVTHDAGVPVIADESVKTLDDLTRVLAHRAAHGVNLKLAKSGGLLAALELGRTARKHGMLVMCGGMVETRLGMSAMAHVACALGGVDYVDLDTAFLLAEEHFDGGYDESGAELRVRNGLGLDVRERTAPALT